MLVPSAVLVVVVITTSCIASIAHWNVSVSPLLAVVLASLAAPAATVPTVHKHKHTFDCVLVGCCCCWLNDISSMDSEKVGLVWACCNENAKAVVKLE